MRYARSMEEARFNDYKARAEKYGAFSPSKSRNKCLFGCSDLKITPYGLRVSERSPKNYW